MKNALLKSLLKLLPGLVLLGLPGLSPAATTLITNINGYTLDGERRLRQFAALLLRDDRVEATYENSAELPEAERIIDGGGRTLIPGLIDAHGHVAGYGFSLLRVDLVGTASEQEAAERVLAFAGDNPELPWLLGRGWNQVLWDVNAFPTAASLDAVAPDRPVWLTRVDGHAGWANTAAMALAGIDGNINGKTPDPTGGQIIRDEQGAATGVFIDTAMAYISDQIPEPDLEQHKAALLTAMHALAAEGLTSVHDAGIDSRTLRAYRELAAEGPLPIRINAMLSASDPLYRERLAEGFFRGADDTFVVHSVKIVGDGALGSRGAALMEDYSDDPGNRGLLRHDDERLEFLMRAAMNAGFQVNTHAIGDEANRKVLDNYAQLIRETGSRDRRHRIEHAQVLRHADIARFAELGVIASVQATHATSDMNMAEDRVGPVRIQGAYAWRKLLDAGAVLANGSDFPVESPNPFLGLHASVTRQDRNNQPPGGWYPEERLSLAEALAGFTLDAAYAGHQEDLLGSLEAGKKADFILLDRDPFAIPASELWQVEVLETWVNGERHRPEPY